MTRLMCVPLSTRRNVQRTGLNRPVATVYWKILQVPTDMSNIIRQIARAIKQSGKTRYRLSLETGIDQGQLSKLMKGQAGLSTANLEKIADALNLEITLRPKRK